MPSPLPPIEQAVLDAIFDCTLEGRSPSVKELCRRTGYNKPKVRAALEALERGGLIGRDPAPPAETVGGRILEGDDDERIMQLERTRRGACARCGESSARHIRREGKCHDGNGSYAWAQTRTEMQAMIGRMEDFVAKAKGN